MSPWLRSVHTAGRAALLLASCGWFAVHEAASARTQQGSRITRVIRDVTLKPGGAAAINAVIADGSAVQTGEKSRAELTSSDGAVTRLGANTTVAAGGATRLRLEEGAVLFQAPANARSAKVSSGVITIATRGATGVIERHRSAYVKVLVLEGTARVFLPKLGESVLVHAGQMLITKPEAKSLPEAVHFDIEQLYKTSLLTNSDFAPLPSQGAIARAMAKQKSDPDFIRTNLVIFGRGTLVNLVEPNPPPPAVQPRVNSAPTPESRVKARPSP